MPAKPGKERQRMAVQERYQIGEVSVVLFGAEAEVLQDGGAERPTFLPV